jgi:hypothetical protein
MMSKQIIALQSFCALVIFASVVHQAVLEMAELEVRPL